jgi:aminopeptidase N
LYKGTPDENRQLKSTMRGYLANAGKQWESPLIAPTNHLTIRKGHFQLSYRKPAFMLLALENLLGKSVFKKCLKAYIKRWEGKHPTPYDFMFTFNDVSNKNLNWFWTKWIFEYGYADVALKEIKNSTLTIDNIGGLPVPVKLKIVYADGTSEITRKTAELWKENTQTVYLNISRKNQIKSIDLISDTFPDINTKNNRVNIVQ